MKLWLLKLFTSVGVRLKLVFLVLEPFTAEGILDMLEFDILKVIYYHGCLWVFMGVPGRILVALLLSAGKNKVVERISRLC
jgi:hypothetical protein